MVSLAAFMTTMTLVVVLMVLEVAPLMVILAMALVDCNSKGGDFRPGSN